MPAPTKIAVSPEMIDAGCGTAEGDIMTVPDVLVKDVYVNSCPYVGDAGFSR